MSDYVEIWANGDDGFIKGKRTKRGEPTGIKPLEVVTLVGVGKIEAFLGARSYAERLAHLRDLRSRGILLHDKGRLTQSIHGHGARRCYAFSRRESEIPRVERGSRAKATPTGSGTVRVLEV